MTFDFYEANRLRGISLNPFLVVIPTCRLPINLQREKPAQGNIFLYQKNGFA